MRAGQVGSGHRQLFGGGRVVVPACLSACLPACLPACLHAYLPHLPPSWPSRRSALYMMVAAALNAADVHFTLPPFPGDAAAGRAYTALERQAELAEGMGLPAAVTGAAR